MWFTRVSISNPVFATMLMVGLLVLGLFSYGRLAVEQFPNVEFPVVVVSTKYTGASPEVVESDVTRRIEEAVNTISGLKTLTSRSYEGQSLVIAEFDLRSDAAQAAQDVREKVAAVRGVFRKEVDEPVITRFNPEEFPILSLAIRSPRRSVRELTTLADQVVSKRVETARGVGRVTRVGGAKREIGISLRPVEMEALGVGVEQVVNALRTENRDLPAGTLRAREQERVIQIEAAVQAPQELREIIVARRGTSQQPVRLWQVADVVDGPEEVESLALYNGERMVALEVVKNQGENTIEVVEGLTRAVAALQAEMPPGMAAQVVRDTSRPIRVAVDNVRRTLVEGAILTVLIVFLFLNSWRSTVITGLTLLGFYVFARWLVASKFGRVLQAIRDAESRVMFCGYNPLPYKLTIWTISAVMCGISGALYVPQVGIINPGEMSAANSIEIAVWAAVGTALTARTFRWE